MNREAFKRLKKIDEEMTTLKSKLKKVKTFKNENYVYIGKHLRGEGIMLDEDMKHLVLTNLEQMINKKIKALEKRFEEL